MAYTPQFYPGSTSVGINRRKHMSGNVEKLRDIPEADVVAIMEIGRASCRERVYHPV